ncbi:EGF-like and EMI domain-containing protein 1 [Cricetulus griseus]|nr:EGF-like and EMI domain-containing protein 1 [Cricetulus griseus]
MPDDMMSVFRLTLCISPCSKRQCAVGSQSFSGKTKLHYRVTVTAACPGDHYGQDCVQRCSCGSGKCDPVTGRCHCPPGLMGSRCQQGCPQTRYGTNCELKCMCKNGGLCSPVDGSCTCGLGWTGDYCEKGKLMVPPYPHKIHFRSHYYEHALPVIMAQTANSIALVKMVVFAADFLEANAHLDYLGIIVINLVTVKEKVLATQPQENASAHQGGQEPDVKQSMAMKGGSEELQSVILDKLPSGAVAP